MEIVDSLFQGYVALGALGMALAGAGLLAMLACAFAEKGWQAGVGLAAFVAALVLFGGAHPLAAVLTHPWLSAMGLVGYFAAGSFWSVARFRIYTGGLKNKFKDFKVQWLDKVEAKSVAELDSKQVALFRTEAAEHMARVARHGSYPVKPQEHKAVILFWMGWWPVSIAAYVLDEPIKKLMEALYRMFSGVYAKIAHDQSREYLADMGK